MRVSRCARRLGLVASLILVMGFALPATAWAAPGDVAVSSTAGWQPAPISPLIAGQKYTVQWISGTWTVDFRNFPQVGPAGYTATLDQTIWQGCKVLSTVPYARLLGRIGGGQPFAIGAGGTFTAKTAGELPPRIKHRATCLGDHP